MHLMGAEFDKRIARIAAHQHGLVTRGQLRDAGLRRGAIQTRVRAGRLHRLHRGVYAVGHVAPNDRQRFLAAVLACGNGAALSHQSAAYLWGFLKPVPGPVHVTSPSRAGKAQRQEVVLHRSPSVAEETMRREDIPVTVPRRTIEDLARTLPPHLVRRAQRQAEFAGYRLGLHSDRTRSDLERDFLRFLRGQRFPVPAVNFRIGKHVVDFVWRPQMVVVETDFFSYHRGSVAFDDDHQRDLDLRRLGYTVRRYTGTQLNRQAAAIAAELRQLLGLGPAGA